MYVLLLIVAGGMAADALFLLREREERMSGFDTEGLVLLIVSCGFACRHSQRLQACGLAVWRCCRYIANKARASAASARSRCSRCSRCSCSRHPKICEVGCWRRCKSCCGALCARCRRPEQRAQGRRFGFRLWSRAVSGCSTWVPQPRQAASQFDSVFPALRQGKSKRETRCKARAGNDLRSDIQTCAEVIRCFVLFQGRQRQAAFTNVLSSVIRGKSHT